MRPRVIVAYICEVFKHLACLLDSCSSHFYLYFSVNLTIFQTLGHSWVKEAHIFLSKQIEVMTRDIEDRSNQIVAVLIPA